MTSRSTRSRRQISAQQPEPLPRAKWNASLTKILADLMVDQVHMGNKSSKSFNKKGWTCICDDFHKQTGLPWGMEQLKTRYAALRKQYFTIKTLLDQGNFHLDESTGVIIAEDLAWEQYLKEHPDAEAARSTGCAIFNQLSTIFGESDRNGKCYGSAQLQGETLGSIPQHMETPQEDISSSESEEDVDYVDDQKKLQSTALYKDNSRKRGRKGIDDAIASAILEMAAASKLRAEAIKKFNERFSITDCVRALDQLVGVDDQVYFAALDLFNNRTAREIFLSLKVDKRLTWLQRKCFALPLS